MLRGYHLSTKSISKGDLSCRAEPPGEKFCCVYTSSRDWSFLKSNSLHSKRFQSSYSGKVGERAKRLSNGEGEGSYSNLFYDLARNSLIFQQRLVGQIKSDGPGAASDRSLRLPCLSPPFATFLFIPGYDDLSKRQ